MASLVIRDMGSADEYYVSTCTHVGESDEIDACARTLWAATPWRGHLVVVILLAAAAVYEALEVILVVPLLS